MSPTRRDPKLDLAKAALITLVVMGHYTEAANPAWKGDLGSLLRVIYMVHMPAFVFLSGITSRARGSLGKAIQWLTVLAVATPIYWGLDALVPRVDRGMDWDRPYWILWFLLALAAWQALMPLVERYPRALVVISVVVGIGCGLIDAIGRDFSLSRAAVFWPFFVIGAVYGKRLLAAVDRLEILPRIGLIVAAAGLALTLAHRELTTEWFYGTDGFTDLHISPLAGLAQRTSLDVAAFLGILAIWALLPRRETVLTAPGRHSLAIYLFHGIPVTLLTGPLRDLLDAQGPKVTFALIVLLTAATVTVFSPGLWDRAIRWVGQLIASHLPVLPAGSTARRRDDEGRGRSPQTSAASAAS